MEALRTDVAIIGRALGACAATLAAARAGMSGHFHGGNPLGRGQVTNQAVSLDEHPWFEEFEAGARYRKLKRETRNVGYPGLRLRATSRRHAGRSGTGSLREVVMTFKRRFHGARAAHRTPAATGWSRAVQRLGGNWLLPDRSPPSGPRIWVLDLGCWPFQIPLGGMIRAGENLLPAEEPRRHAH